MKISPKTREKAFRLRLERRPFTEVSKEVGVSAKTLARWEAGWIDAQGRSHAGWKPELERLWREKGDAEMQYGLMLREERLKTYEELARLAVAKIKEAFPRINAKTPADVKLLLSEVRELLKMLAKEKGEWAPNPRALVAVKADVTVNDLRERYKAAEVVEVVNAPSGPVEEDAEEGPGDETREEERGDEQESEKAAEEAGS